LRQARQYRTFTVPVFLRVASRFASKVSKTRVLTRKFLECFVKRHRDVLSMKRGKLTSPTRSLLDMMEKTEGFIASLNSQVQRKAMNERNIVVFDETIIGDSVAVPVVIGEHRRSGGNTNNFAQKQDARLGCYIPFSMPDGTTPFRVFIFTKSSLKNADDNFTVSLPENEKGLRGDPVRVNLSSATGYLNKALFKVVITEFATWWKSAMGGLDCFLISDCLVTHRNKDIVQFAESLGIHMYNIMPGSSHWFQVHDQQPFGGLKKKMKEAKYSLWTSTMDEPTDGPGILTHLFYQAEEGAFERKILKKTFDDVGLWPWNPEKIRKNCEEHCPVVRQPKESRLVKKLLKIISDIDEEKRVTLERMKMNTRRARVISEEEVDQIVAHKQKTVIKLFGTRKKKQDRTNKKVGDGAKNSTEPSARPPVNKRRKSSKNN